MAYIRARYRRGGRYRSRRVRSHYRRSRESDALLIIGGALLIAFVVIVLSQST